MITGRLSALNKVAIGSVTLLTIMLLGVFDLAVAVFKPLKFLNGTGIAGPNQYFITDKLPEFLVSDRQPDVVMTGSSLFLFPAVRCDDEFHARRTRYDKEYLHNHVACYSKADYFQYLLGQRTGKNLDVVNLATLGELMSDQYLVFKKSLDCLKKPKVLICDISPRAFLDNNLPDPHLTPVYLALNDQICLGDLLDKGADLPAVGQLLLGKVWHYFQLRGDYRGFVNELAARLTNHPRNLYFAMRGELPAGPGSAPPALKTSQAQPGVNEEHGPVYEAKANGLLDLDAYRKDYLPLNLSHFDVQKDYFKKMLLLAREKEVAVLLVDMPLLPENLALLPPDFLKQYRLELATLAKDYRATLIAPGAIEKFTREDFEDSAHLNAAGGRKLYRAMAAPVAGQLGGNTGGSAAVRAVR